MKYVLLLLAFAPAAYAQFPGTICTGNTTGHAVVATLSGTAMEPIDITLGAGAAYCEPLSSLDAVTQLGLEGAPSRPAQIPLRVAKSAFFLISEPHGQLDAREQASAPHCIQCPSWESGDLTFINRTKRAFQVRAEVTCGKASPTMVSLFGSDRANIHLAADPKCPYHLSIWQFTVQEKGKNVGIAKCETTGYEMPRCRTLGEGIRFTQVNYGLQGANLLIESEY